MKVQYVMQADLVQQQLTKRVRTAAFVDNNSKHLSAL